MRLLFIVENYPPERGAVRYVPQVAEGLAAKGHDVTVITGLPHYPHGKPYDGYGVWRTIIRTENGVKVIRVPLVMGGNHQTKKRIMGFITFIFTAGWTAIRQKRPHILVTVAPPATVSVLGPFLSKLWRIPFVMLLRDVTPWCTMAVHGTAEKPISKLIINFFTYVYKKAKRIVLIHPTQIPPLLNLGVSSSTVEALTHWVDVPTFIEKSNRKPPITLPRKPGRKIALYMGSLGRVHGLTSLFSIVNRPEIRELPIDFVFVGGGECSEECQQFIDENHITNVSIYPPVQLDDVPSVMCQADLLISSSKTEYNGIVVSSKNYEYLAAAKPIFNYGGQGPLAAIVRDNDFGWAVPYDDATAVHQALSDFASNPEKAVDQGIRGRAYVSEHYAGKQRIDRWEELLAEYANIKLDTETKTPAQV